MPLDNEKATLNFFAPIGLASVAENKHELDKILRMCSFAPDFLYEKEQDKRGRTYFDRYKYLGDGFGVNVHGYRYTRTNNEGKKIEKHIVLDWGIFAFGESDTPINGCFIDCCADQRMYCVAKELIDDRNIEFRANNSLELLDKYKALENLATVEHFEDDVKSVNIALLMSYGTVLLPVEKTIGDDMENEIEEIMRRQLRNEALAGDLEAELVLEHLELEKEIELSERLKEEDMFSVFESYLVNTQEHTGVFAVLLDILSVQEITNKTTKEKILRINAATGNAKVTTYINKSSLIGLPTPGMRIAGMGILQGRVNF